MTVDPRLPGSKPGSLGRRIAAAVGWSAAVKAGFQVVTWGMTLAVIRVLSPDDYGLMALAQLFTGVLAGFSDFGMGDALVQRPHTPRPMVAGVFGLLLLVSGGLAVLVALAAYPIAAWYHDARLVPLIQVSGLSLLLNGLTTIPRAFLLKSLLVRPMFMIEMGSGLAGALCVIALAYAGWGVWALMLGVMAGNLVRLAGFGVLAAEAWVWPSLDVRPVRPLLAFGAFSTLEYVAWAWFTSADVLIIGRLLGPESLGLYSVALNFAGMPLNKLSPIINQVAFPAFALVQHDPAQARFYAVKAMRLLGAILVPVLFGVSAVAPEIVGLVFGPQWTAAAPMLAVLAVAMGFRAILVVLPRFLQGIGDARAGFWCTATAGVVFPLAFLVGCRWGIMGVCVAWLVGYPVVFVLNCWVGARRGRLPLPAMLQTPLRPMAAGLVMLAAVAALRPALPGPDLVRLAALAAAGAAVYLGVMALLFRGSLQEVAGLITRSRHQPG